MSRIREGTYAEDDRDWNWATMGNRRRGVYTRKGKKLVVGARRFARIDREGKVDWTRTKRSRRGDRYARKYYK